jgi:hypothetical protein
MNRRPLLPRGRTPSGHEIPVPESEAIFQALHGVSNEVKALASEVRTNRAADEVRFAEVEKIAKAAGAQSVERWTNLAKALVPAVVAIIGGTVGVQKLTAPSPVEPTRVYESELSQDLRKCAKKPDGEQQYCVAEAYERSKRGSGR